MLAATAPAQSEALELFRLVFEMRQVGQQIPSTLESYALKVIEQTRALLSDPIKPPLPLLPEAIVLATTIRRDESLRNDVQSITSFESINKEQAVKILKYLEVSFDSKNQPFNIKG